MSDCMRAEEREREQCYAILWNAAGLTDRDERSNAMRLALEALRAHDYATATALAEAQATSARFRELFLATCKNLKVNPNAMALLAPHACDSQGRGLPAMVTEEELEAKDVALAEAQEALRIERERVERIKTLALDALDMVQRVLDGKCGETEVAAFLAARERTPHES